MPKTASPPEARIQGAITLDDIAECQKAFEREPRFRQAMNAVCNTTVTKVAQNRRKVVEIDHTFSHHLEESKATSQMSSGRCWMFAALNVLRAQARKNMNLGDDFELSQNYVTFWDKFEKANYFLESILQTLDEPDGSRITDWLLTGPIQDGGQWHMFINLVKKYGIVPKTAMPETESSSATNQMGNQITQMLRDYACRLRTASRNNTGGTSGKPEVSNGQSITANGKRLQQMKDSFLAEIYRMLCIHLGEPPKDFRWQWRDKDKNFHRDGRMTPKEFYDKHVAVNLDEYVCLIHDPRPKHSYNTTYTVRFLGNVVGGEVITYLNVEMPVLKKAAVEQIKAGDPVWFGNDVGKFLDRDLGVMDLEMFDFELVYGAKPKMSKAERLIYGHSQMTHAMVFTGVDLGENDEPIKWRVENSWGEKGGDKGFMVMTDAWFDEFTYEVVVHRRFVPAKSLKALDKDPIALDPWDPMGSLARS
ncbi:MAG: C1 family peptidase [Fimbriimonadaceae bacterium]